MDSSLSSQDVSSDSPVLPSLASQMRVDVLFSKKGDISILHDGFLSYELKWVEYDQDLNTLSLVSTRGQIQDVGLKMPEGYRDRFAKITQMYVCRIADDGSVDDFYLVPLMTNAYGLA